MIYEALKCLEQELNQSIKLRFDGNEFTAALGAISDQQDAVSETNQNKLILSFINLNYDSTGMQSYTRVPNKSIEQPLIDVKLSVLITAMCSNYDEALKLLSSPIYFFQGKSIFDQNNSPGLDSKIEKMSVEMVNTNYEEILNLWKGLGSKYIPSVLIEVRVIYRDEYPGRIERMEVT